jgi:complement component 1 Q subcomponent-binding protein
MIRSNLLARRIAVAIAPKQAASYAVSSASSTAMDALLSNRGISSASSASVNVAPSPLVTNSITSRPFSADAATELGSILQREINEETEAAAEYDGQLPPELASLQSDIAAKWTILEGITGIGGSGETGSGATVRMFRKDNGSKGAKIGIVFHCQDTEDDIKFDENELFEDQSQDEGEEEEETAQAVRFGVTVSKGGKTVVLQCRSGYEVNVESVMVRDGDTESVLAELAGGEGLHAALYQGPEFTELAEDLQISFQNYVINECGVDEDVTAFISMYCDYREQEEYVTWMKTAIDILD